MHARRMFMIAASAVAGVVLAGVVSAQAQSFNCRYAKKPAEVAICQHGELAWLDEALASKYFEITNLLREWRNFALLRQVERSQRRFLRQRNRCGYSRPCIRRAYLHRLQALDRLPFVE